MAPYEVPGLLDLRNDLQERLCLVCGATVGLLELRHELQDLDLLPFLSRLRSQAQAAKASANECGQQLMR